MKDTAIRNLYTNVSSIIHSEDGTSVARDDDGNIVSFDTDAVATEVIRLQAEYDNKKYQRDRKEEYDQLNQFELIGEDSINGTTKHKDAILAIKAKHPKE